MEGDVLVDLDRKSIEHIDDLQRVLTEEKVGVKIPATILRQQTDKLQVWLTPAESPRRD
jgi:S1-C subfamily serine protease